MGRYLMEIIEDQIVHIVVRVTKEGYTMLNRTYYTAEILTNKILVFP